MEYEEATRLYRRTVAHGDDLFRLTPTRPSAALSYRDDDTWYLRGEDGRLIARVSPTGVRVVEPPGHERTPSRAKARGGLRVPL